MHPDIPFWLSLVLMLGGLAVLAWSSDVFVDGAAAVAKAIGVSPFVIGMVVIGFGTIAPELCVSTMSGPSGHAHVLLGNAYGSNIFNILRTLGLCAAIVPLTFEPSFLIDGSIALGAAVLLAAFGYAKNHKIRRWGGLIMFLSFVAYYVYLFVLA